MSEPPGNRQEDLDWLYGREPDARRRKRLEQIIPQPLERVRRKQFEAAGQRHGAAAITSIFSIPSSPISYLSPG